MRTPFAINAATLMPVPFPDELHFYAGAGFKQVELWLGKIERWMGRGEHSTSDAKELVLQAGLTVVGGCALSIRLNDPQALWSQQQDQLTRRLTLARALEVPRIVLTVSGPRTRFQDDLPQVIERCRWVAQEAEKCGIDVALEFLARMGIVSCLPTAIRVIREVGCPNFGLLIDLYHFYLSESRFEDLSTLPDGRLFAGHVDDALNIPIEWLTHDDRTFPGEGVLPCRDMIDRIGRETGFEGPWSIELHSKWIWQLPPAETMRRLRCLVNGEAECRVPHPKG